MFRKLFALLAISLIPLTFSFLHPTSALADGIIIPDPPFPPPVPIQQLNIRFHRVEVTIEDQVAITRVDQVFHNPNSYTIEGTYIFPLPKDAVVTNFKLWIDGQPVEGKVLSAEEARRTYEEIVRRMVDPALLEYVDRGAVQARIFPIDPDGERRIELEYTQVLTAENGLVRYSYPLNTEKFSLTPLENVSINVDVRSNQPIRALYSPTHDIGISRESRFHILAGYEESDVRPDRDFLLYYSVGEAQAFHLLTYRDPSDPVDRDGFYLLLLAPRPDAETEVLPKDVVMVLDRSGSMDGDKFIQAQAALRFILDNLNPEDRFNVISFSTDVESFADRLLPASEAPAAMDWVDSNRPLGSTDINRALLEAVSIACPEGGPKACERPTFVIFLTDGLPTVGEVESQQILNNLAGVAPDDLRLFAFGVGYDVDTFLLDSLAQDHHGASTYVPPGAPIDEIVSGFYEKVSTPVLTNLELTFDGVTVFDDYPTPLPDLFVGSQIVVVGRYRDGGVADVTLTGEVNRESQSFRFPEQVFARESGDETGPIEALPRLWATRKIGFLLNQVRLHGPDQETIDQIVSLSIRYGIVTPYTSYLVTEDLVLGESEIRDLAADEFNRFAAESEAPVSGQQAVEKAAGQGALEGADTAFAPPAEAANQVRVVGYRTFVFVDGAWVDTAFDPGKMDTVQVPFLSDDYFDLVAADPNLGSAFALGPYVVAFSEGVAYEVVESDAVVPPVDVEPIEVVPTKTPSPLSKIPTPISVVEDEPQLPPVGNSEASPSAGPCLGGLLPLAVLPLAIVLRKRKK